MKKIIVLVFAVFAFTATNIQAQTDNVVLNVILTDVLDVNVTAGDNVTFTFDTPAEWTSGMTAPDGGQTTVVTVDASQNWDMSIDATDLTGGTGGDMPAENIGVYCQAIGTHQFGTEILCSYVAPASILGLPNASNTTLMTNNGSGAGNSGNATDNRFNLLWECGTLAGPAVGAGGGMIKTNMLDQVAAGDFTTGTYTTTAVLTLTAN